MESCIPIGSGVLSDHSIEFNLYANIVESHGKNVDGVLWEIDDDKLYKTDVTEGYPYFYDRKLASIVSNGEEYQAHVYYMTEHSRIDRFGIYPPEDYIKTVLYGYNHFSIDDQQVYTALDIVGFNGG
jgi:hypothetical protein